MTLFASPGAQAQEAAEKLYDEGRDAYMDYDFSKASTLFDQARKRASKGNEDLNSRIRRAKEQVETAREFLDRVEDIVIIDSLEVSKDDFFNHYKLHLSAGKFLTSGMGMFVYENEGGDYRLTAEGMLPADGPEGEWPDEFPLFEMSRLVDGSWNSQPLPGDLGNGQKNYPFLMADGLTLYFATDGDESIGGYDIVVSSRDAIGAEFRKPRNMGFPYNSPANDYLLAIDEYTGAGWWATDRNDPEGDTVTIYVFVPNEYRRNYDPEENEGKESATDRARIRSWRNTWPEDADYAALLAEINDIQPAAEESLPDFELPVRGGRILHFYNELPQKARKAATAYFEFKEQCERNAENLAEMRRSYATSPSATLAGKIAGAEQARERDLEKLNRLRSELYRLL